MTTLSFHFLIHRLYNKASVPPYVDRILEVMSISHTSIIKDLANPILVQRAWALYTMILYHFEGNLSLEAHIYRLDMEIDAGVDADMGEHRDAPKVSTKRKGAPTISISSPISTFEKIGASPTSSCPTTSSIATCLTVIPHEFLQCLIEH